MSLARKCDRCGNFYEAYAGQDSNEFGFNRVTLTETDVDNVNHYRVRKRFDLCKKCSTDLEDWLKCDAHITNPVIIRKLC